MATISESCTDLIWLMCWELCIRPSIWHFNQRLTKSMSVPSAGNVKSYHQGAKLTYSAIHRAHFPLISDLTPDSPTPSSVVGTGSDVRAGVKHSIHPFSGFRPCHWHVVLQIHAAGQPLHCFSYTRVENMFLRNENILKSVTERRNKSSNAQYLSLIHFYKAPALSSWDSTRSCCFGCWQLNFWLQEQVERNRQRGACFLHSAPELNTSKYGDVYVSGHNAASKVP